MTQVTPAARKKPTPRTPARDKDVMRMLQWNRLRQLDTFVLSDKNTEDAFTLCTAVANDPALLRAQRDAWRPCPAVHFRSLDDGTAHYKHLAQSVAARRHGALIRRIAARRVQHTTGWRGRRDVVPAQAMDALRVAARFVAGWTADPCILYEAYANHDGER